MCYHITFLFNFVKKNFTTMLKTEHQLLHVKPNKKLIQQKLAEETEATYYRTFQVLILQLSKDNQEMTTIQMLIDQYG